MSVVLNHDDAVDLIRESAGGLEVVRYRVTERATRFELRHPSNRQLAISGVDSYSLPFNHEPMAKRVKELAENAYNNLRSKVGVREY